VRGEGSRHAPAQLKHRGNVILLFRKRAGCRDYRMQATVNLPARNAHEPCLPPSHPHQIYGRRREPQPVHGRGVSGVCARQPGGLHGPGGVPAGWFACQQRVPGCLALSASWALPRQHCQVCVWTAIPSPAGPRPWLPCPPCPHAARAPPPPAPCSAQASKGKIEAVQCLWNSVLEGMDADAPERAAAYRCGQTGCGPWWGLVVVDAAAGN